MITAAIKDKVLFFICSNAIPEQMSDGATKNILEELDMEFDIFNAVMIQFQRNGFIENLNLRRNHLSFMALTEAYDYIQRGGFVAQEEVFKANIEKLQLEIDNLKKQLEPDKLDSLNKISGIASALFSGLNLFP